ncbi:hypothetical protein TWF730_001571 [Orbilia blumenaviensis]|uniref:Uncharacterized protein n=1 Tax=Orbilia blumenaviensis TaxID=1796055 RepID=A0AAV9UJ03_9PEZI
MASPDNNEGYTSDNKTGIEDAPSRSGLLWGDTIRFIVLYFIIQIFLTVTGLQRRFDDWAIQKGIEWRERRRKRNEERERKRLGLEGGVGSDQTTGDLVDKVTSPSHISQGSLETIREGTVPMAGLDCQGIKDYGT